MRFEVVVWAWMLSILLDTDMRKTLIPHASLRLLLQYFSHRLRNSKDSRIVRQTDYRTPSHGQSICSQRPNIERTSSMSFDSHPTIALPQGDCSFTG